MTELDEVMRAHRAQMKLLRTTIRQIRDVTKEIPATRPFYRKYLILQIAEGLIAAHKAAKFDDDGLTLDLIEDALRHIGKRLALEHGDDRNFARKKLGSE